MKKSKYAAAFLWFISGITIVNDLGARPFTDILDELETYNSSTCQIVFSDSYTCSGVLINNTQDQGRPLILTAAHCVEDEEDLNSIVVVFGRRKLLQDQPYGGLRWSSNGASLLSSSQEIDFALLELKSDIPIWVSPIFLGWQKTITQPALISSIHSPDSEDAQYAFSMTAPSLATFGGLYGAVPLGHWMVDEWSQGKTALGSSGAPLLNAEYEIIGGFSGSTEWTDHKSDYYFRFDLAYDHSRDSKKQLKAWLDPNHAGHIGLYQPTHKIRNFNFTSPVSNTISLSSGATITEKFRITETSRINGVYITVGEITINAGQTINISLSRGGEEFYTTNIGTDALLQSSENYIPFVTPPLADGEIAVSLEIESTNSSGYIAVPATTAADSIGYFMALNLSTPAVEFAVDSEDPKKTDPWLRQESADLLAN